MKNLQTFDEFVNENFLNEGALIGKHEKLLKKQGWTYSKVDGGTLKELLELNGYTVISVASAPAKQVAGEESATETPASFTVGVTDVMFNATNAVFGRLLRTAKGQVVTLEYWQQKSSIADGAKPYFSTKN